jgi:hypothetical protein
MARTELSSAQIRDASIARVDLNTQTPGAAVVAKIVAGAGITISQTGADSGTGDVTVSASGGAPAAHATTHNTGGIDPLTALSAAILTTGSLPFARVQLSATAKLLGRGSAGAGAMEEVTLGTGLSMTGTVLNVGALAPAVHATTHYFGANDPINIQQLAGYPGITTQFLNGQGGWTVPPGDEVFIGTADPGAAYELWYDTDEPGIDPTVLSHHVSHEPGGVDALANAAWLNLNNTFTRRQIMKGGGADSPTPYYALEVRGPDTLSGDHAGILFNALNQPVDERKWRILYYQKVFSIEALNDTELGATPVITMTRAGDVTVGSLTSGGQGALYVRSANPSLYLYDTQTTADTRMWRIMNQSQLLRFYTQDDGETGHVTRMWLDRSGNMTVQRHLRVGGDYGAYPALRNTTVANPAGPGMLDVIQANEAQYAGVRAYNFISTGVYNSFADLTCTGNTNFQSGVRVSAGTVSAEAGGVYAYQTLFLNDGGNPQVNISNSGGYLRINSSSYGQVTYMDMAGNWTYTATLTPVGGIQFASTGASASATNLDYYKEIFWAPTFRCSGGGTPTYAIQHGLAVKVGRFVYFGGRCSISAKGSMTSGGWVAMDGLPWVSEGTYWGGGMYVGYIVATAVGAGIGGYIPPGGQYIQMTANTTGGTNLLAPDWINAGFDIIFFGSYYANS